MDKTKETTIVCDPNMHVDYDALIDDIYDALKKHQSENISYEDIKNAFNDVLRGVGNSPVFLWE